MLEWGGDIRVEQKWQVNFCAESLMAKKRKAQRRPRLPKTDGQQNNHPSLIYLSRQLVWGIFNLLNFSTKPRNASGQCLVRRHKRSIGAHAAEGRKENRTSKLSTSGTHVFRSGMVGMPHGVAWAATCIAWVYRLW